MTRFWNALIWTFVSLWRIMPESVQRRAVYALVRRLEKWPDRERALRFLFDLESEIGSVINCMAIARDGGLHPKHRLMQYHEFFIKNIRPGERVLDIGCGVGAVAWDIARKVEGTHVTGIDFDPRQIELARKRFPHPNLAFLIGDASKELPDERFDVAVLSNVLEHMENRVEFLGNLKRRCNPRCILLRVPLFEREWSAPFKKELGMFPYTDSTHVTEYSPESLVEEVESAGLKLAHQEIRWGEIWAVAEPASVGEGFAE